jgi:hypothetical protein
MTSAEYMTVSAYGEYGPLDKPLIDHLLEVIETVQYKEPDQAVAKENFHMYLAKWSW